VKAGEKRKEEEIVDLAGPLGRSDAVNPELVTLEQELLALHKTGALDPFGTYLYGMVLHERERDAEARAVLCASVNAYPWNWSAWLELQVSCVCYWMCGKIVAFFSMIFLFFGS
jgi:anaphase-promoting complex subunit 8